MSTEVPNGLTSALNGAATDAVEHRYAGYHLSFWGDHFLVNHLELEVSKDHLS